MKNRITISIMAISTTIFASAEFNALITKEHNEYKEGIVYNPTGEITCNVLIPEVTDVYKNTPFTQQQSDCYETYRGTNNAEKLVPVEDRSEDLLGTLVLEDCQAILNQGHSVGNGIYPINAGGTEFNTQCEMTIDGGGWTLIASKADDGQHYWTWNNQSYLYSGGKTGDPSILTQDYQNEGWANVIANDVLLSNTSFSRYMIYGTILNNEPMKSEFTSSNTTSSEYTPRLKVGTWWFDSQCDSGIGYMKTATPDTDGNGWAEGSKGFIWRSRNNNGCSYDDTSGGLLHAHSSYRNIEQGYNNQGAFYTRNFDADAMAVWVR